MTRVDDFEDRRADQLEARLVALGTRSPQCSVSGCKEEDPFALTGTDPDILCCEHRADEQGRTWTEAHHPPGRRNDPATVPLPANDHGAVSAEQALWPRETLRNPQESPLVRAAAWIRGFLVIAQVLIERYLAKIPPALERLDALLTAKDGPVWWEQLGWDW